MMDQNMKSLNATDKSEMNPSTQNISWLKYPTNMFEKKSETAKQSEIQKPANKECLKSDKATKEQKDNKRKENRQTNKTPVESNKEKQKTEKQILDDQMTFLNIIEKTARKLKSDPSLADLLNAFFKIIDNKQSCQLKKREMFTTFLENIVDMNVTELEDMGITLKSVFSYKVYKHLFITDENLMCTDYLHHGEFSEVLAGTLFKNNKVTNVAIKRGVSRSKKLIENEAVMLSQLDHKHIIKILGVHKNKPIIVLELMEYGRLGEALSVCTFTNLSLMTILEHIASAMEYMHGKDILHRDISCLNVLVNNRKQCKLSDFAMSVFVGDTNGIYHEKDHDLTSFYMAPEAMESQNYTKQTDVWAMGIFIIDLFTAVNSDDFFLLRHSILNVFRLGKCAPVPRNCPIAVYDYTVKNILVKDPSQRPNFSEIKEKLHCLIENKAYTV